MYSHNLDQWWKYYFYRYTSNLILSIYWNFFWYRWIKWKWVKIHKNIENFLKINIKDNNKYFKIILLKILIYLFNKLF